MTPKKPIKNPTQTATEKFALGVEYDGSAFYGFQKQKSVKTVQETLEKGLSRYLNQPIKVVPAGRTDAGVHAKGQVVHFCTTTQRPLEKWLTGANACLESSIRIQWIKPVSKAFHAQKSAVARLYRYYLYNHRIRPSLFRQYLSWHAYSLEITQMQQAAQYWLGQHDFSAFKAAGCQSLNPVKTLFSVQFTQMGAIFCIEFKANAFLQHMIRNMIGVLLPIGAGRKPPEWAKTVLESRNRQHAGVTACPNGLYLEAVFYDPKEEIPVSLEGRSEIGLFL